MEAFNCPITYEQMRDPVVAMDGHTYERTAIERWISESTAISVLSPMAGIPIGRLLIPNYALKKAIEEYVPPLLTSPSPQPMEVTQLHHPRPQLRRPNRYIIQEVLNNNNMNNMNNMNTNDVNNIIDYIINNNKNLNYITNIPESP